jgi:hypothetical protein
MQNQILKNNSSTFQELVQFLNVLNGNKATSSSFLKKGDSSERIVVNLERQFSRIQTQPVFYKLQKRQLSLSF